ncbi:MAG: glycosyltransferases involved in cell wall biogenesis, partial [halophilic archaeon J07HB67]
MPGTRRLTAAFSEANLHAAGDQTVMDREEVCVLLPTYQEAETVGRVVTEFREAGFDDVLVIDGGSTDDTRTIAREAGARVAVQSGDGKGQAIREAVADH